MASGSGFTPEARGRRLRLGALYGGTPRSADALEQSDGRPSAWPRATSGRRCPFLRCATEGCDGDVVWLDADRRGNRELLTCDPCGWKIATNGELALTREALQS